MFVVATAGHVDHGKSTLVRALTGMEPDRQEEERRRGLTIDLGYAWTRLGEDDLVFVDVPGHERFIATMLAGVGPAPAVMFVVAADQGWRRQSSEHLAAIDALGLENGVLVVTRSDLAEPGPAIEEGCSRISASSLGHVEAVAVSGRTGAGLDALRGSLTRLVRRLPAARTDGPLRLWVDRSFVIRGAGTVITGTLGAGRIAVGDELSLAGQGGRRHVRGLHCLNVAQHTVTAVSRVAVNLRGVTSEEVGRGDALLTPDSWQLTDRLDVRRIRPVPGRAADPARPEAELATHLVAHLGTAAVPARVRRLDADMLRLTLDRTLPVERGDRLILRDPGRRAIAAGAIVVDVAPPELRRRGAAAARARELRRAIDDEITLSRTRLTRAGALPLAELDKSTTAALLDEGARLVGDSLVDADRWASWKDTLTAAIATHARDEPLDPRLSLDAGRHLLGAPDRLVVAALAADAGLIVDSGWILQAGVTLDDRTEGGLAQLEHRLDGSPFAAPERPDLDAWGLGLRELAAAERLGRIVRLTPDVVVLPTGPSLAMRTLSTLRQPFTTSEARQALGTTRRVVIPLLEHLDRRGWTQRVDPAHRRVRR